MNWSEVKPVAHAHQDVLVSLQAVRTKLIAACDTDAKTFARLRSHLTLDITETRVYRAVCQWLSSLGASAKSVTLQQLRLRLMAEFAREASSCGLQSQVQVLVDRYRQPRVAR